MRLCLMTVPGRTDNPRLGLVGTNDLLLDANEAHATALAGHMEAKRAYEIADALVPSDLYGFIRGGRHGWRALELTLEFLATEAVDPTLRSPRGERVVLNRWEVDLRAMVGREPDADRLGSAGRIVRSPIGYGDGDDRVSRASYSLGDPGHGEYIAIVARACASVDDFAVWDHIAGYMKLSAATSWQALYLQSVDELHPVEDTDVYCDLADAMSLVSRHHALALGDVVRAGARALAPAVDLRDNVADGVLERLLTHSDT